MGLEKDLSTSFREPERVAAVRRTGLLDGAPDPALDRLSRLAGRLLRCQAGLVCLGTDDRLFFVSVQGTPGAVPHARQTPLGDSFCQYTIATRRPFTVDDAREHETLRTSRMVTELGVRAYAGVPLFAPGGQALGTLCVLDTAPRQWTDAELADLGDLGTLATAELHRRLLQAAEPPTSAVRLSLAHDFNDLLTGITGHVSLLQEEPGLSARGREDLSQIQRSADRAASLTRQLIALSRRPSLAPRVLDLNQLVAGCLSTLRRLVGERVQVVSTAQSPLDPIVADPNQLEQALTLLCGNARDAMPDGGTLEIATSQVRPDDPATRLRRGQVLLQVRDTGRGMGDDMWLGLATVQGIVKQSGGHLDVVSEAGRGTTFTISLPRHEGSGPIGVAAGATEPVGGTETILLVEDDEQLRELARRVLERVGYTVLAATDAESATAIADRRAGHIHLLVTDMQLPQLSGRELAARLSIHRPAIKVIYVSGTSDGSTARLRLLEPGMRFLEKPFSLDRLLRTVRQTLGDPEGGGRPP
ncbi:MAG: response regulator [Gemmatimonadales bacterium]